MNLSGSSVESQIPGTVDRILLAVLGHLRKGEQAVQLRLQMLWLGRDEIGAAGWQADLLLARLELVSVDRSAKHRGRLAAPYDCARNDMGRLLQLCLDGAELVGSLAS